MRLLIFNLRMDADDGVLGFTTDWVNALAARCERVVVITMEAGAIRVADNVEVFSVGKEQGYGKLRMLARLYSLTWGVLRSGRIDAVFAHMNYLFALLTSPMLKIFRKPVTLWFAHGSKPLLLRPTVWISDRIVASSAGGFQLKTSKLRLIGQGIDTDRFVPAVQRRTGAEKRLLTLGRISRIKRIEMVIDAIASLKLSAPHLILKCDLVGEPLTDDGFAYQSELADRIKRLGLDDDVCLLPGVPFHSAHEVMNSADLFINSADTDSVDKTVLEALSCGVPVVTSNAAFIDILPDVLKATSLVPKNDVDALARAIQTVCELTPDALSNLQKFGRQTVVDDHSLGSLADRIMKELREVARLPLGADKAARC